MALPVLPVTTRPAPPITGTLYDAAIRVDSDPPRFMGGIQLITGSTGPHGQWPVPCSGEEKPGEKTGPRPEPETFPGTVVWAADECHTVGVSEEESTTRATEILKLIEPVEAEKHAAILLIKIPIETETSIIEAVAKIEEKLSQNGYAGVIHARRGLLPYLHAAKMIVRQGTALYSPGGHQWVFGAGYAVLGNRLVGTGRVVVHRGTASVYHSVEPRMNIRRTVAEVPLAVGWEPPTIAVTISPAASAPGSGPLTPGPNVLPGVSVTPEGGH